VTAATTAAIGERTGTMTEVTVGMTAATGGPAQGCYGDSSMRARTPTPTTPTRSSRAMRVHGLVTW
jgi:hypothetical protein